MTVTRFNDRDGKVEEYLQLMRSLARELERAMTAIAQNSFTQLEESVSSQQAMSARLAELASGLHVAQPTASATSLIDPEDDLMLQIRVASAALQSLNQRYAALIAHSSRSVAMMVSLFNSFQGNLQEAPRARPKLQTWSCQV
jgi:hypothetical protein